MTDKAATTLVFRVVIKASAQAIWDAITKPEWTERYAYGGRAHYDLRKGGRYWQQASAEMKAAGLPDELTVGEVIECDPPSRLAYSWSAGGPVVNTRVSYRLEEDGEGTRLFFEHSGFDMSQPWGEQAFRGAGFGWAKMLERFREVLAGSVAERQ